MLLKEPYFMKNREWYWYDEDSVDEIECKLTDKAPEEAKKSYKEFYEKLINSRRRSKPFVMSIKKIEAGIQEYKKLVAEGKLPPQD